jgi:hypothetical protein
MTNDSNDPEWIRCVRTFIATEDSVFLTRAVAACSDFTIREFLRQPGVREYTTPRGEYEQLAARLNGYGRQVEAGVIALLGLRGYLVVASHPEALTEQQQEQTRDSCCEGRRESAAGGGAE